MVPNDEAAFDRAKNRAFINYVKLLKQSYDEKEIALELGLSVTQLRKFISVTNTQQRIMKVTLAKHFKEQGHTNRQIARLMGISDYAVRSLLEKPKKKGK